MDCSQWKYWYSKAQEFVSGDASEGRLDFEYTILCKVNVGTGNIRMAEMTMNVAMDRNGKNLNVSELTISCGDTACVRVVVEAQNRKATIESLFYSNSDDDHKNSDVWWYGTQDHLQLHDTESRQRARSDDRGRIGKVVIDMVTSFCDIFLDDKERFAIHLTDAAQFTATRPGGYPGLSMSNYLRWVRGVGYYESRGFYDREYNRVNGCNDDQEELVKLEINYQQEVIAFNNRVATTPLRHLPLRDVLDIAGRIHESALQWAFREADRLPKTIAMRSERGKVQEHNFQQLITDFVVGDCSVNRFCIRGLLELFAPAYAHVVRSGTVPLYNNSSWQANDWHLNAMWKRFADTRGDEPDAEWRLVMVFLMGLGHYFSPFHPQHNRGNDIKYLFPSEN